MNDQSLDVQKLLQEYERTAIDWDSATGGAPRIANRLFDKNKEVFSALRTHPDGRAGISRLMDSPRRGVRLLAATHSLRWEQDRAVATLEELERGPGLHAVSAKYTLRAYRANTLKLD